MLLKASFIFGYILTAWRDAVDFFITYWKTHYGRNKQLPPHQPYFLSLDDNGENNSLLDKKWNRITGETGKSTAYSLKYPVEGIELMFVAKGMAVCSFNAIENVFDNTSCKSIARSPEARDLHWKRLSQGWGTIVSAVVINCWAPIRKADRARLHDSGVRWLPSRHG